MRKKNIYECCGRIGHNNDDCIICRPKLPQPCLIRKINQFDAFHGYKPTDTPIDWNRKPPEAHFKHLNSNPKTSPVVSAITGRLNHNVIDNGDVEVHSSEFPAESNSESVPDTEKNPIKSFDDYKIDYILEFFRSEHGDYLLNVDLQILQA